MEKPEKRSLLWGPRRDWEDNIKRDFKEMRNNGGGLTLSGFRLDLVCDFGTMVRNSRVIYKKVIY